MDFRRSRGDPDGAATYAGSRLIASDISEVSVLRKRAGRAAASVKIVGALSAVYAWAYFPNAEPWSSWVGAALGVLVYWCARRLSKRLRAGDFSAAGLIAVWWLLWVAANLIDAFPKAISNRLDSYSAIGMVIFVLPIYLIARGLIALLAHKRRLGDTARAVRLPTNPWESGGPGMERHPAFINKRSLSLYYLLLLVPLPYLFIQLPRWIQVTPIDTPSTVDASSGIEEQVGSALPALAIWVPLTVFLYRRARRKALLPAAELGRRSSRPPILYLRSFRDDEIKIRARAANGRSNLERILKIRFEEVVTDHLWRYGPVVAIGRPGDRLPPLGAARDYVPDERWQQTVEQLMLSASLVVVVAGRTEGLAWEIRKLIELDLIRKLVILFPPVQVRGIRSAPGDLLSRWNTLREQAGRAGLTLPENVDPHSTLAMVLPRGRLAHAVVSSKRDEWAYETALDAAVELVDLSTRRPCNTAVAPNQP